MWEGLKRLWRLRSETRDGELAESCFSPGVTEVECGEVRNQPAELGVALVCHLPTTDYLLFTLLYPDSH
jgi:hypothetical protein